jgi:hypothetical protein
VCKKVVCDKEGAAEEAGPRRDGGGRYRIKNKNPTQRCGEKARKTRDQPRCFEVRSFPLVQTSSFEEHFKEQQVWKHLEDLRKV